MLSSSRRVILVVAAVIGACTLVVRAQDISNADAEVQYQLGNLLSDETRYQEALAAFDRATHAPDFDLAIRARKGKVKTELRLAEFVTARADADQLRKAVPADTEAATLYADAMWATGLFDEADVVYEDVLRRVPGSARARFGVSRSLATKSRLDDALREGLSAVAASPRDGELHAGVAEIYERLNRFDEAAASYTNFINLLPNKDRSDKAAWSRAQVQFLKAFEGRVPVDVAPEVLSRLHTVPFRLVNEKVVVQARVNGGALQDFMLDTGSEETVISRETAERQNVKPITYTLSAGVGEVGLRGLQLARIDRLEIGTLAVQNLPVLIKNPALRGIPKREGESFSPLSLGLSMTIDYQRRLLTIGRTLPEEESDFKLPMRVHRLAMVRGLLNETHSAYFVVDTGGQVISISSETAEDLNIEPGGPRRIPLRVYGTSGWDRDAFLLPGQNLEFDRIEYKNYSLVVLNLRAPSLLLGFRLGGIVGHTFLGNYRVTMDMARSELRLRKF
ncbi:MAG: retroviral-like aspartic protease family protein [Vicinamibacterales bacterium]